MGAVVQPRSLIAAQLPTSGREAIREGRRNHNAMAIASFTSDLPREGFFLRSRCDMKAGTSRTSLPAWEPPGKSGAMAARSLDADDTLRAVVVDPIDQRVVSCTVVGEFANAHGTTHLIENPHSE
jgi:hypothetical protein